MPPGSAVVALSGGADSAVAAWALVQLHGPDAVRAVHVHHGFADSDTLAAAARDVAAALGVSLAIVTVDVPAGASQEGQARAVRLAALESSTAADEWLVTGHHGDDAVETVIGNLLRGAGASGLSGMASRRGRWVRPLLGVARSQVRLVAAQLELPFVDDPANDDRRHRRNVIRHDVVPLLDAQFPGHDLRAAVGRSAAALASDDAVLDEAAAVVPIHIDGDAVLVPAALISTAAPAVAARIVRRALRVAHPPYPGSSADVAGVRAVACGSSTRTGLTGGWFAEREGAMVAIYANEPDAPDPVTVAIGESAVCGDVVFESRLVAPPSGPRPIGRWRVRLGGNAIGAEMQIRVAQRGERIDLGGGSKLVRDAMAEVGIPRRLRAAWPVVAAHGRIAWLTGARIAAWARPEVAGGALIELSARRGTTS
jgi:tRNA(Ile)-lysidine synthase